MRIGIGAHDLGRAEKLAWEYPFTFRTRQCSISLQKFGMYLYVAETEEQDSNLQALADEIISKISTASRCIEKRVLALAARDELREGRVTIQNQAGRLRAMYEYFRQLADQAYAGEGVLLRELQASPPSGNTPAAQEYAREITKIFGEPIARDREGFYATIAMINAYFSLFEHLLVLSLPATDFDPASESLTGFIGKKIFEKYDRVFDANGDQVTKRFRARLQQAAEVWRNPYGHGAFDKRHGTLYFQIEGIGTFPAILSDIRTHPTFQFFPDRGSSYDEACALFDEIDAWLRTGPIRHGIAWAEAGLSVSYAPAPLREFRSAVASGEEAFTRLLESRSYLEDQAINMDW